MSNRAHHALLLTPREWDAVASLCELAVDATSLTFGEYAECNGTRIADGIRERMRKAEEAGQEMKDNKRQQDNWRNVQSALSRLTSILDQMQECLLNKNKRLGYGQSNSVMNAAADLYAMHIKACMEQAPAPKTVTKTNRKRISKR